MDKRVIVTETALQSTGPISQAVRAGDLIFTAGMVGKAPGAETMAGPDFASEARQALENLKYVVEAAGSCPGCVVKVTVYLTDIAERPTFNDIYREYFPADYPARTAVQVVALAGGARVEVEAVAIVCPRGGPPPSAEAPAK